MDYKVSFTPNNCKDGQGNLQMRVRWATNTLAMNVGYIVSLDKWDRDLQQCKNNTTHGKKKISAAEINKAIRTFRVAVNDASSAFLPSYAPATSEFRTALLQALGKEEKTETCSDLIEPVITEFIIKESKLRSWSTASVKKYHTIKDIFRRWKPNGATLADLDKKGLEGLYIFLQDEGKVNRTISKYMVSIKGFIKWVDKSSSYNVPKDYETFSPRLKVTPKTIVWLNGEELKKLYDADLTKLPRTYQLARDIFCFSCYTGMRFSDMQSLRHSDVYGDKIHLTIIKTAEVVTIELNKYSREILLRYKDADPMYVFPRITNQVANREIKKVCELLGISTPTTSYYYKGSERMEETQSKHEYITMHTGRRTFICSALEKGISPLVVMQWTGHKDYEEMKPYINISDKAKETAMKLFDE